MMKIFIADCYHFYRFLLLIFLISDLVFAQKCPCFCESNRMNCANQNWKTIPSNIPIFVTVINFQFNAVTDIRANTFSGLDDLTVLRLESNKIKKLEANAFNGLPKLNNLVLSNNEINDFDESMLDSRSPLKEGISLNNNKIKQFPLNVVRMFKVPLNVADNKIKCDCFSVIPNSLKHLVTGTCHSPGYVKGVSLASLSYSDVKCDGCSNNKCVHGSCYTNGRRALCQCLPGYTGEICDKETGTKSTPGSIRKSTEVKTTLPTTTTTTAKSTVTFRDGTTKKPSKTKTTNGLKTTKLKTTNGPITTKLKTENTKKATDAKITRKKHTTPRNRKRKMLN